MPAGMAELWEVFGIAADSFRKLESTELQGWLLDDSASLSFSLAISKKRLWCALSLLPGASSTSNTERTPFLQPSDTLATQSQQKIL